MNINDLPDIHVSYKKLYPYYSPEHIQYEINRLAGSFFPDINTVVLSYGKFTKKLLIKYNRTIEKQACNTISHEIIHWLLLKELNIKACSRFDNIAENLHEYGVY